MKALIDVVKWDPKGDETLFAYKFPQTNLTTNTQLIVAESQEAILFSKGQIVGKFGPGKHTLDTENLPGLKTLFGLPFAGKNPYTAEIWFVNKLMPLNLDWTIDSMTYEDPDYRAMVPLVAKGRYGVSIIDAEKFCVKLVGTAPQFTAKQLTDHFSGAIITKTKSILLQFILTSRIGLKSISAFLDKLSDVLRNSIAEYWEEYGFRLINMYITTIEVDSNTEAGRAIQKAMTEHSAQLIGGYSWADAKSVEIAHNAIDKISHPTGYGGGLLHTLLTTKVIDNLQNNASRPLQAQPYVSARSSDNSNTVHDVFCSNCAKKFQSNMKFCPHCGDPYIPCPSCGADNDANAQKCVTCGTLLSAGLLEDACQRCGYKLQNAAFCPQCGLKNR
jgi:membrane protease subunit (stomatin/prohibitin family)